MSLDSDRSRAVVAAAARAVASLKESEFDVRFNPDVYSAGIRHAAPPDQLARQRHLVKEAAAFLLTTQIPAFVSAHYSLLFTPFPFPPFYLEEKDGKET